MVTIDYVDENDKTIGTSALENVVKNKQTYREVLVMISNEKQELFIRKENGVWSTSLRGPLVAGEIYEDAALRLLAKSYTRVKESSLEFYSKDYLQNEDGTRRFVEIYKINLNGPFKVEGEFCSVKKIRRMVEEKQKFSDELKIVLKNYYKIKFD